MGQLALTKKSNMIHQSLYQTEHVKRGIENVHSYLAAVIKNEGDYIFFMKFE